MDIEHNSREKFYRFPFGAVTCGGEVRLRLAVSGAGIPSAVRLVYMEDGKGEVRKDMPYIFDVGDHCIYSVNVKMPEKAGLVWYYFELENRKRYGLLRQQFKTIGGIGENVFQFTE